MFIPIVFEFLGFHSFCHSHESIPSRKRGWNPEYRKKEILAFAGMTNKPKNKSKIGIFNPDRYKLKYIICFIVLTFISPCFSDSEDVLSQKKKDIIYNVLSHLMKEAQKEKPAKDDEENEGNPRGIAKKRKVGDKYYSSQEEWQVVFGEPEYNDYVKKLFKSKEFSSWIKQDIEPLFFAIHFRNEEMVRFLSKRKGIIHQFKRVYTYPVLFASIINEDLKIINFFFNHPEINLSDKDSSNSNMFHYIFFGLGYPIKIHKKSKTTALLFNKKYFAKISHLLNEVNNWGATPFDYFLRDFIRGKDEDEKIMKKFLDNGAVPIQLAYIFLKENLNKEEEIMKEDIYKSKKLTDNNREKIISNIKAYNCKKALEQEVPQALAL